MKKSKKESAGLSRRGFLDRGMRWSVAAGVCPVGDIPQTRPMLPAVTPEIDEDQQRLIELAERFGGELGDIRHCG